ncbi:YRA1 [Candida pseudojiufengensis]|uniref:YRA1 n=1 Tax=Candida pseudojiufengensis TaxID=497109 RepID=UPI0022240657|nr:YRA1 [Candida pseudojiufengensis]KAI5965209.1 YRA1 [Candida pseudojiufengensis]
MSTSLDRSLDDIISSSRKTFKGKRQGSKFGNKGHQHKVGKKLVGGNRNKKQAVSFNRPTAPKPAASPAFDLTYATKVNVSGLPRDLKQDNIKEFFQSQVGGVQTVALSYNEKGQFKGYATVIFKSNKNAALAVEKYNGASIDGGAAKLRLELVIDTSKKPLAARIAAKPVLRVPQGNKVDHKKKLLAKKNAKRPAKKPQQKKRTVEELDQEMADYFQN